MTNGEDGMPSGEMPDGMTPPDGFTPPDGNGFAGGQMPDGQAQ
jgi:hypothetical protein